MSIAEILSTGHSPAFILAERQAEQRRLDNAVAVVSDAVSNSDALNVDSDALNEAVADVGIIPISNSNTMYIRNVYNHNEMSVSFY